MIRRKKKGEKKEEKEKEKEKRKKNYKLQITSAFCCRNAGLSFYF
jgi:hypothetical protein